MKLAHFLLIISTLILSSIYFVKGNILSNSWLNCPKFLCAVIPFLKCERECTVSVIWQSFQTVSHLKNERS